MITQSDTVISATEEIVREPLGATIRVGADRQIDDLRVHVRRAQRVRLTTYEVETLPRDAGRLQRTPQGEVWVWTNPNMRRVKENRIQKATREVTEEETGVATSLRVVTDGEVFDLQTDDRGEATIPLARLFGPTLAPGRVTLAHGDELVVVRFDGSAITTNRLQEEPAGR